MGNSPPLEHTFNHWTLSANNRPSSVPVPGSDFGKNPSISAFGGSQVSLRRSDGCQVATSISPYPAVLHNYVAQEKWDDAVRLCRFIKVRGAWHGVVRHRG